ncbi:MAG: FemAB family XrtA/PEP-CTERM system-associated protein [Nitrospiraceae bacterium]
MPSTVHESAAIRVELLGESSAAAAEWDRYVQAAPEASGYQLTAWRTVIARVFGHEAVYLVARDERGEICGLLPLVVLSSRLFGRFMVSLPFFTYGGVLATTEAVRSRLMEAAVEEATKRGLSHIELRQQSRLETIWPSKDHKVSMRLALPTDPEALMKQYPSKLRSQIRRPQKEGMVAEVGGIGLLDEFYTVFARNMRDLGTPVYAKGFFQAILEAFPQDAAICVVRWKGQPVAAGFLYRFRQMMEIPWASADRRYDRWSPNMLLYSTVLEYACRQGCQVFDFGRSSIDSGTYRFKAQWGAEPVPLHWYYWLKGGGPLPELNPNNPKYKLAIGLWQQLPLSIANLIGPHVVKNLP